ncbi:hypothetical protein ACJ73_00951 [Blastomyces percursus]|uniref:Uncharacterized protein n=1 Tax=Blastomyces percursus TaxID=1658174 RepID=A0A1J9RGH7_9EURO|nr:hypothetical protein ACJ73_00951 [Blastomyces percursus]
MADIQKALTPKKQKSDPKEMLPDQYRDFLDVFDRDRADQLSPFRGPKVDHVIGLKRTPRRIAEDGVEPSEIKALGRRRPPGC